MFKMAALLALAATPVAADYVTRPPAEYRGGPAVTLSVTFAPFGEVDPRCRAWGALASWTIVGCQRQEEMISPDPCDARFEGEKYASVMCHEVAHARGWRHPIE